jgi:hypothetical protein
MGKVGEFQTVGTVMTVAASAWWIGARLKTTSTRVADAISLKEKRDMANLQARTARIGNYQ